MDSVSDECDRTGISSFLYEFLLNGRRHIKFYEFWRILNVFIFTVLYKGMSSDLSGAVVVFVPAEADPPPPPDEEHPDNIATANRTGTTGPTGTNNGPSGATGPTQLLSSPVPPLGPTGSDNQLSFLNPGALSELTFMKDFSGNSIPPQVSISYVKKFMNEDYSDAGFNMSTSMDIIAVYIKAQKILYTEAKVYCEQQLNMLMLPAICISAICTLLSLALQSEVAGPYVISALTAVNSFILALISYLKLDAKAEAHKTSAYHYSKLLTICEFQSGKIMFFKRDDSPEYFVALYNEMLKLIIEIEKKIEEIQDTNKFILPQYIRYNFRTLNEQNLFSKVKNLQLEELKLLNELKISLRRYHEKQQPFLDNTNTISLKKLYDMPDTKKEKLEYLYANADKEKRMKNIISHRKSYLTLEEDFEKEIDEYVKKAKGRFCNCNWLKS